MAKRGASEQTPKSKNETGMWVRAFAAADRVAEKFGVAFVILLLLFAAVYKMGSAQTQDDFIRELLFASVTHTRYLSIFVILLVLISTFGLDAIGRLLRIERSEMRRISEEKTKLQEKLLERELS